MECRSGQFTLHGLGEYANIINNVIDELDIPKGSENCFDIRLILTEAITNAFKHGNKGSKEKPIYLRYRCNGTSIRFEIEDSGSGIKSTNIPFKISNESILKENGRGLFLINMVADKVDIKNNTMIIEKILNNEKETFLKV